jgi:hypothetical protein
LGFRAFNQTGKTRGQFDSILGIIGNKNQQKRCPRKTPITLKLEQKDWAFLRFFLFRPFRDFRGQISLISDNGY